MRWGGNNADSGFYMLVSAPPPPLRRRRRAGVHWVVFSVVVAVHWVVSVHSVVASKSKRFPRSSPIRRLRRLRGRRRPVDAAAVLLGMLLGVCTVLFF